MSIHRTLLLALAFALPVPGIAGAQGILVAPPGIFIEHRVRSGALELFNPSSTVAEIGISTIFGYPVSDSAGTITMRMYDEPDGAEPSAAAWIQAYPRRLTLAPGERQTVRLLGRPPADLPDGEYWTRLIVSSRGAPPEAEAVEDANAIQIGVAVEVRTVVAVLYRKGRVETSVQVSELRAAVDGDALAVRLRMVRGGNAAFIGTVRGSLVDGAGREVARFAAPVAVYHEMEPRFVMKTGDLPAGGYTLRLQVDTDREDVRRDQVLRSAPVRRTLDIIIPSRAD